jgi:tRNA pseudouridine55 synthase
LLTVGPGGLVVVDKPGGMTSHDVVSRVRRLAHTRRVGHGGTLDPMATGVLVVGVERGTRLLHYVVGSDKSYLATIRLGATTVTDDAEGEVLARTSAVGVDSSAVRAALAPFVGEIDQVPTAVSAVKVDGVRAYRRVRAGEAVELAPRRVTISRLDVMSVRPVAAGELCDVDVEVDCSSGTYVRAIARDLGAVLGVGGHLTALRRTKVGAFTLGEAATLDELAQRPDPVVLSLAAAAERLFPRRDADPAEAKIVAHGGWLPGRGDPGPHALFAPDGELIAILNDRDGRARPEVVFAPAGAPADRR